MLTTGNFEQEGDLIIKPKQKICQRIPNFDQYTLLLPSVSVGNVGQLAVDILISTLCPDKIALLYHPALLPLIGYDPYNTKSSDVTTSADLHLCASRKLLILQIRSPLILRAKASFLSDLTRWIKKCSFSDIIILSSCHAHLRHDSQLVGSQFRFLSNNVPNPQLDRLKNLGAIELEEREDERGIRKKYVPGAGFMYDFLEKCEIPAVGLMKFVDEGDNTNDAAALVAYLNSWTEYQDGETSWKVPFSWKNLFGAPPPALMY